MLVHDMMTIRTFVRNYRFPIEDIQCITSEVRAVGPLAWRRSCLVVEQANGVRRVFADFNSSATRHNQPPRVATIAETLNQLIKTEPTGRNWE